MATKKGTRKPITWAPLERPKKAATGVRAADALHVKLGDGEWTLVGQVGAAFGQYLARSCARSVRAAVRGSPERPWAVRGELPLDEERSACGCTTIVFGGVRMQLPDKVFGNNWMELRHAGRGVAFCFDCAGALERWARLSVQLIDDRRAGRPAWSGWTCDAALLRSNWENSTWGAISSYTKREEWDWTFRTDYAGVALCGDGASGSCARRASALKQHVLIRAFASGGGPPAGAAAPLTWHACEEAEYEAVCGPAEAWTAEEKLLERSCKLYEDNLSEVWRREGAQTRGLFHRSPSPPSKPFPALSTRPGLQSCHAGFTP